MPKYYHYGPWQILYKVSGVLCPDGKRRTIKVTGEPTTYYTVPGRLTYRGTTVTGLIMSLSCPHDVKFIPTGKNAGIFPPVGEGNELYAAAMEKIKALTPLYNAASFPEERYSQEAIDRYNRADNEVEEWLGNKIVWSTRERLNLIELYALLKVSPSCSMVGAMIDRAIAAQTEIEHKAENNRKGGK